MHARRILRDTAQDTQKTLVFTSVFVIVWVGSAIVTLNSQLLGGTLYVSRRPGCSAPLTASLCGTPSDARRLRPCPCKTLHVTRSLAHTLLLRLSSSQKVRTLRFAHKGRFFPHTSVTHTNFLVPQVVLPEPVRARILHPAADCGGVRLAHPLCCSRLHLRHPRHRRGRKPGLVNIRYAQVLVGVFGWRDSPHPYAVCISVWRDFLLPTDHRLSVWTRVTATRLCVPL